MAMDPRVLLASSITLIYQESKLPSQLGQSTDLVKEAVKFVKIPEASAGELERNPIAHLRSTVLWMCSQVKTQPIDRNALLQRIRISVGSDDNLYNSVELGLEEYTNEDEIRGVVDNLRNTIREELTKQSIQSLLSDSSYKSRFKDDEIVDWGGFVEDLRTKLGGLVSNLGAFGESDPAFVSKVDFGDVSSIEAAFRMMTDSLSDKGSIAAPWKAMCRLFGDRERMRRGEFWLVNALPHNYKSGMLVDFLVGIMLFNKPELYDPTKKALIDFMSSEDDIVIVMQKIYVILRQIETGCPVIVDKSFDHAEASRYVHEKFAQSGYNLRVTRVLGSRMTYRKYIDHLESYKKQGFEVCVAICDYFGTFSREGCVGNSTGDDLQYFYRIVREYTATNNILAITAHQLSTEAKQKKREKPEDFIHDLPGKGYYQGCKKLDDEVDGEIYINKQVTAAGVFLEVLWGKHRKLGSTAEKHKYFVLMFNPHPMYGLAYDFDRPDDISSKRVGVAPGATNESIFDDVV